MCSTSEVEPQHQRGADDVEISDSNQGHTHTPAVGSAPEAPLLASSTSAPEAPLLASSASAKLQFQLDTENLELVECGDSTAWCLGQPEHPIKVKEFSNSSGRSQLFRIEEESHKMIQTMDSYSA